MAKSTHNMNLLLIVMATLSVLSSAQQPPVQMPPVGQLPPVQMPPTTQLPPLQTPPVQMPPVGQLPPVQTPPVPMPPNTQLPPTTQTPPVQIPPVQTPPAQTPSVQTPSAGTPPVQSCTPSSAVSNLAPCVSYLVGNSSSPTSSCCTLVSSLLQSQSPCLCLMLKTGLSPLGYVFNQTQSLSLPSICNMPTNPCMTDVTGAAPGGAPTAMAPSVTEPTTPTPVTAEAPSVTTTPTTTSPVTTVPTKTPANGVKATPAAESGGVRSSGKMETAMLLSVVFVASYMSF